MTQSTNREVDWQSSALMLEVLPQGVSPVQRTDRRLPSSSIKDRKSHHAITASTIRSGCSATGRSCAETKTSGTYSPLVRHSADRRPSTTTSSYVVVSHVDGAP